NIPNAEIEKLLKEKSPKIFDGLSNQKKNDIINAVKGRLSIRISNTHIGPLPSPDSLTQYKDVDPTLPSSIVEMAQKEQNYSHTRDNKIIENEFKLKRRGQLFAFLISIFVAGGGLTAIMFDHEVSGSIFGGLGLTGLVALFLGGRKSNN
ncbi:MAG TPA: DUF2335 domain-containing protein, partial [Cyclobacteriaceae bacterium]